MLFTLQWIVEMIEMDQFIENQQLFAVILKVFHFYLDKENVYVKPNLFVQKIIGRIIFSAQKKRNQVRTVILNFHSLRDNIDVKHLVKNEPLVVSIFRSSLDYLEEKRSDEDELFHLKTNRSDIFLDMKETKTKENSYLTCRTQMKPTT